MRQHFFGCPVRWQPVPIVWALLWQTSKKEHGTRSCRAADKEVSLSRPLETATAPRSSIKQQRQWQQQQAEQEAEQQEENEESTFVSEITRPPKASRMALSAANALIHTDSIVASCLSTSCPL